MTQCAVKCVSDAIDTVVRIPIRLQGSRALEVDEAGGIALPVIAGV